MATNEIEIKVKVRNEGTSGLTSIRESLSRVGEAADGAGSRLASSLGDAAQSAAGLASKLAQTAGGAALVNAASSAASGGLNLLLNVAMGLLAAVPAIVGGFLALAPALLAVGGAAGAAATALAGVGIAGATLAIGFGGIGAALKAHGVAQAGAGKAASNTAAMQKAAADRISAASRQLRDAKEAERDAAEDVNRSRRDEVDRLRELDLALRGANISQAEAAQALAEAQEKNRRAQQAGSDWEKAEAKNAVARAQLTYDEQSEKLGDLTAEKKKSVKDGVEGSDQVQAALDRESKAHERVQDAVKALADAKRKDAVASGGAAGGVNQFAAAMDKLSPNARALVYALLEINKRFDAIKRQVQDRLLAGFAADVTDLADKWLPHLDDILGNMADHLNILGRAWMRALGDSTFIKNIEEAGKAFGTFIDHMKNVGTDLIDIFGRLAGAAGPVLDVIGGLLERIFDKFDKWIRAADDSGQLDTFMKNAADTLQRIFDVGGLVFKVIGQVIAILFPQSAKAGNGALDAAAAGLQAISDWLNDPKNQKKITEFVSILEHIFSFVSEVLGPVFSWLARVIGDVILTSIAAFNRLKRAFHSVKETAGDVFDWIGDKAQSLFNWFGRVGSWLSNRLGSAWDGLKSGFRNAINWVVSKWNGISFSMPGILGGGTVGVPQIPYLARGGIAGGLAMVGERGRELVRLPQGSTVIPNGTTEGMMRGGQRGSATTLYIEKSGNRLVDVLIEALAGQIRVRGGNVQVVLGGGTRAASAT